MKKNFILVVLFITFLTGCSKTSNDNSSNTTVANTVADNTTTSATVSDDIENNTSAVSVTVDNCYEECIENAKNALAEKDYDSAIQKYEEAKGLDSTREEAYIGLFETYLQKNPFMLDNDVINIMSILEEGADNTVSSTIIEMKNDFTNNLVVLDKYRKVANKVVEYVREYEYNLDGQLAKELLFGLDGTLRYWNEYEYDNKGNLVRVINYSVDGSFYISIEYEYDNKGNQIRVIQYSKDGTSYISCEKEYDLNNKIIKSIEYNEDGSWYLIEEYDEAGNVIKKIDYETWYSENGEEVYRREEEYDTKGNVLTSIAYDVNEVIWDWKEYEYDKYGNITKSVHRSSDGSIYLTYAYINKYDDKGYLLKYERYWDYGSFLELSDWVEYEYDIYGNETKYTWYDNADDEEPLRCHVTTYDEVGNLIKYIEYFNQEIILWTEYEYDKDGKQIRENSYDENGNITNYTEYEYDMMGNCISKITYRSKDGAVSSLYEYEYWYYYDICNQ